MPLSTSLPIRNAPEWIRKFSPEIRSGEAATTLRLGVAVSALLFPALSDLQEITLHDPASFTLASNQPTLRWDQPLGVTLTAAAVFQDLPTYSSGMPGNIQNLSTASVWLSSQVADTGSGTALFSDQHAATEQNVVGVTLGAAAVPLSDGVYYWGVWAWTGSSLTYRSQVQTFAVTAENLTGQSCSAVRALADVQCINDTTVGGRYQALACASDADCYQGTTCDLSLVPQSLPWGVCRGDCDCRGGCACGTGLSCAMQTGICFSNQPNASSPFEGSAACGCRTAPSARGGTGEAFGALLTLLVAWWRTQSSRLPKRQAQRNHATAKA
jgi:hypothetical protein